MQLPACRHRINPADQWFRAIPLCRVVMSRLRVQSSDHSLRDLRPLLRLADMESPSTAQPPPELPDSLAKWRWATPRLLTYRVSLQERHSQTTKAIDRAVTTPPEAYTPVVTRFVDNAWPRALTPSLASNSRSNPSIRLFMFGTWLRDGRVEKIVASPIVELAEKCVQHGLTNTTRTGSPFCPRQSAFLLPNQVGRPSQRRPFTVLKVTCPITFTFGGLAVNPKTASRFIYVKLDEILSIYRLVACCMETIPVVLVSPQAPYLANEQAEMQQMQPLLGMIIPSPIRAYNSTCDLGQIKPSLAV
ncbi:hypothetical protein V8C44DRAFT_194670 [Trichoderma aethiopicum]